MERKREQVVKILECISRTEDVLCQGCEYRKYDGLACHRNGAKDALALIKELTEENERLRAERDVLDSLAKDLRGRIKGLQRANESLAKDCDLLKDELNECVAIKADTVRQMQERLTTFFASDDTLNHIEVDAEYINSRIDKIAKEMEEGL